MTQTQKNGNLGTVYLVGAGPGDPGLLTIQGKTLLEFADVVVYDALVSPQILSMINPQAKLINVGNRRGRHSWMRQETIRLLIQYVKDNIIVIHLKEGDPSVFGQGGEEMADLVAAGVSVKIIPGITSGLAVPTSVGIPLAHRNYSSSIVLVTGHEPKGGYQPKVNWQAIADAVDTIVVYMGLNNLSQIIRQLTQAGLSEETPIALIRWGTRPEQEQLIGSLSTIAEQISISKFGAPAIAVIGKVVELQPMLTALQPKF